MKMLLTSFISTCFFICLEISGLTEANYLLCDRASFDFYVHNICIHSFNSTMAMTDYQRTCPWPSIKYFYNALSECVNKMANLTKCVEPALQDEIFLEIHEIYFPLCASLRDPELHVLLLLILPCICVTLAMPFLFVLTGT